jgi:flagellar basal-body rod modification protein FlgD
MAIAPTTATVPTTAQATGADSALSQLSEDYTQFLTLLTAQISNQDPLAPMDSTQFVSQLAQLTQVEQAVLTNDNLEGLSTQIATLSVISGPNMLGEAVTVPSNAIELSGGTTNTFYELPQGAVTVSAEIRDPYGYLVRTVNGMPVDAGVDIPLGWDGTDDIGQPVLDGNYTVTILAKDAQGEPLPAFTYREAEVQAVTFTDGQVSYLLSGNEIVLAESVIAVR